MPSSSPPRRPPLGPHHNHRRVGGMYKPADGKENIPPRPGFTPLGVRVVPAAVAPTTAPQPATVTTDATQTDEAPAPATTSLPPWRLPGAFATNDDEDEEKAILDKHSEENDLDTTGSNNNASDDHEHDSSAPSAADAVAGSQPVENTVNQEKKDDVEQKVHTDESCATGATLNEDHDSGDSHTSPVEFPEAPATFLVGTAPINTAYSLVNGEDHDEVDIFEDEVSSFPPFVWTPFDERVDNWELVDYGDEFHDLE